MKLIVFADSHTDVDTMSIVIGAENPDMVIHLGDHVKDGIELHELFIDIPMEFIKGNTDRTDDYPEENLLMLDDKLVFITHGDQYDVEQGLENIIERGICDNVDIILFGHTHKPYLNNHEGILVMNPGRIGRKSRKKINATYGIIILDNGAIECKIIEFD